MDAEQLQNIANAVGRGHLKHWKAVSMLMTYRDLGVHQDRTRLRKWVTNCLEMECFDDRGIDAVTDALMNADWEATS